ncbi:unnamed protein product [Paramecium primaurelia]|uniref:Protein kinase domain-containing protein n=1 Tax=Paramecium primaurelia TaxID=5886 RepID=A0A8S1PS63_PARPR|nr:unnamed protein product [Paramecium primaurelia]
MDLQFSFQVVNLSQNYQIRLSQPKIVNTQLYYQNKNEVNGKKLRDANLYYPCRNIQTNQNFLAQLIYIEPNKNSQQEIAVFDLFCKHPHTNIIKIFDLIEKDHWYVIQEDITLNLEEFMKIRQQLSLSLKINFFQQLISGFKHLKLHKIILRDLQPKHILVKVIRDDEYILKISDFRSAEITENGKIQSINGMSDFAAPETFIEGETLTNSCCVYTLGMLLYYICNDGKKPFQAESYQDFIQKQKEFCQTLSIQQYQNKDDDQLRKYYKEMLIYDKNKRNQTFYNEFCQDYFLLDNLYFLKRSSQVGEGQQGTVVDAINIETQEKLVCKMIQKKVLQNDEDMREIQVCEHLKGEHHQNIIKIIKIIKDPQWYFIFFEKCEKNMKQFIQENKNYLTDLEIIDFLSQIIQGYNFLKQKKIVHRDLKPENIMIKFDNNNNKIYKIIDFGVSKIVSSQDLACTDVGSLLYKAPEILENEDGYTSQCDIFSLGALMYYMMYNKEYINAKSFMEIAQSQKQLKIHPFKCPDTMRNIDIKQLIEKMIVFDPAKRISWEQLMGYKLSKDYLDILNDIYSFLLIALQTEQLLYEIQPNYKDNVMLTEDIYAHRSILLKFIELTFQKINQSFQSNSVSFNETEYKINQKFNIDSWKMDNKWNKSNQLLQQRQQKLEKKQITQSVQALNVIQNMEIKNSEIPLNFKIVHRFYMDLPNLLKNPIILQNESIQLKYHLLKMRNLFNDFTYVYILGQSVSKQYNEKISEQEMQTYFNSNN